MITKKEKRELSWFVPRWSFQPAAEEAVAFTGNRRFWTFCFLVPMAVNFAIWLFLGNKFPEVHDEMPRHLFGGIAAVLLFLFVLRYVIIWIPPIVSVNKWGIRYGNAWARPARIKQITIDVCTSEQPSLIIERIPQAEKRFFNVTRNEPLRVGISQKISLLELTALIRELFPTVTLNV